MCVEILVNWLCWIGAFMCCSVAEFRPSLVLCCVCVSGCRRVGLAGGGRGAADGSSSACSTLSETLQLLQPVADTWRHGVRWPSVLADGALPRSRPEHHLRRIGLLTFRWSEVKRVQDQELADRLWMFDFLLRRFGAWRPFMWPRPLLPYTPPVFFFPPLTLLPSDNPPRVLGQLKTTAHMTSVWKKELSAAFEGQRIWEMTLWLCPRAWQQNIIASLNSLQTLSALRCPWCAVLVP